MQKRLASSWRLTLLARNQHIQPPVKKRKIGFIVAVVSVTVLIIVLVLSYLGYRKIVNTPNPGSSAESVFVIEEGEGLEEIAGNLRDKKLITNAFVFQLYMKAAGTAGKIQAGEYSIAGNLTMEQLGQLITLGKIVTNKITIPEGWDIGKISNYLAKNTVIEKTEFEKAAIYDPSKHKYDFLKDLKSGDSLEGFLYPDTYQISLNPTADEVIEKMLDNFDKKLTEADRAAIKKSGMSTYEVVTLASIVEREVANASDRKLVASVFLNRLNAGMALESCATVQYFLGVSDPVLTYEQTHTPSPYNTYLNTGLPPTPIGNPSIDSIEAVLFPTKSSYFYFLSADGKTYFSKTLDEHNAKKAIYIGG